MRLIRDSERFERSDIIDRKNDFLCNRDRIIFAYDSYICGCNLDRYGIMDILGKVKPIAF